MNTSNQELTFDESIKAVLNELPPPIRSYVVNREYSAVAQGLMKKYSLHIDQAAVLEREILLLLMGIEDPQEFAASLKSDASLSDQVVQSLLADVNQEVFIPLHQKMRAQPPVSTPSLTPIKNPPAPTFVRPAPIPAPSYVPPAPQPPIPPPQPAKPVPPQVQAPAAPRPFVASSAPTPPAQGTPVPRPPLPPTFGRPAQEISPSGLPPRPIPPPPPNLPGAMPPPPAASFAIPQPAVSAPTSPIPPVASTPPTVSVKTEAKPATPKPPPPPPPRSSGIDPYREPIE